MSDFDRVDPNALDAVEAKTEPGPQPGENTTDGKPASRKRGRKPGSTVAKKAVTSNGGGVSNKAKVNAFKAGIEAMASFGGSENERKAFLAGFQAAVDLF